LAGVGPLRNAQLERYRERGVRRRLRGNIDSSVLCGQQLVTAACVLLAARPFGGYGDEASSLPAAIETLFACQLGRVRVVALRDGASNGLVAGIGQNSRIDGELDGRERFYERRSRPCVLLQSLPLCVEQMNG